ncbi:MAG: DNA polymerase beta superfamily protein [Nitrospirales bacterium]
MADSTHTILKVLVGSHAHGLAGSGSDADYRSVFVIPTVEMFHLGFTYRSSRWSKGNGDETAWEVGECLSLGVQGHPLILETLLAPVVFMDSWGADLRALFPALWTPRQAFDAFVNYGVNQRRKFLDKKDGRPEKYAAAYIRVLYNLCELLDTGSFTIRTIETPIGDTIARLKRGEFRMGEVVDLGEEWTREAEHRLARCWHEADLKAVDAYLIRLRKAFLED